MNKSTLIEILKDDALLSEHSMESLAELETKFPHFSIVKILMAKKARMTGSEKTRKIIENAAVSGAARPQLFRFLNEKRAKVLVKEEKPKAEKESILEETVDSSELKPVLLPYRQDHNALQFSEGQEIFEKPELPEETNTREEVETDLESIKEQLIEKYEIEEEMSKEEVMELIRYEVMEDLNRLKFSQEKLQEGEQGAALEEEDLRGLEINRELIESLRLKIENFTRKYNIDVSPVSAEELSSEEVRDLMTADQQNISEIQDFLNKTEVEEVGQETIFQGKTSPEYTETMALLYEKQGAFEKAINVYEQLKLIYPKKNTYFAHRIEVLRDRG